MQSQRQKKKNAQFKRKKHEAKERSEARSKRTECWSSEQTGNKEGDSKLALQPTIESAEPAREIIVTTSPASTEKNRYRKRAVESNWDKYDLPGQGGCVRACRVYAVTRPISTRHFLLKLHGND